jgi:two-component system, NtrC family, sensor histidine kinase HydH
MKLRFGLGWQFALVVVLFVGSLGAMLFSSWTAFGLPGQEEEARDHVRDAGRRLAEEAVGAIDLTRENRPRPPREWDRQLRAVTERVLGTAPGIEGGFYLRDDQGRGLFLGYAFPTRVGPESPPLDQRPPPPPPRDDRPPDPPDPDDVPPPEPPREGPGPKSLKNHPPPGRRGPPPPPPHALPGPPPNDPPPKERRYVLSQVEDCLNLPAGSPPAVLVRDVEAVGDERPARLASWVMVRITGPEQQRDQLHRYQASAGLALGGIALSAVLMGNLVRTLRRERQQQDALREELRRSENLASLGRLLAGVAHEVRNPLAALRSTVQLWQRLPDRARTPESMDAVVRSVDRLNDLVSRLLYFARSGHDARRQVDVNALVRDALELMRAQADGQKVTLGADLDPKLPALAGSPQALQQVVVNLTGNALQAMPAGGRLECQTRWLASEDEVELRVRDTGPGVPADARDRLFEPFFTTRAEGTGLGLALCREIVRQHGGSIDLAEGNVPGAEFVVRLPRGKPEGGQP